jgi:hypothetical protein
MLALLAELAWGLMELSELPSLERANLVWAKVPQVLEALTTGAGVLLDHAIEAPPTILTCCHFARHHAV